jgi:hypothetical protein
MLLKIIILEKTFMYFVNTHFKRTSLYNDWLPFKTSKEYKTVAIVQEEADILCLQKTIQKILE